MKFEDDVTISDKYGRAMDIINQAEADVYFEACIEHTMRFGKTREEAEEIERNNLGYYAGYYDYDNETRERIERLFSCAHPFFGKISEGGAPTPQEAFNARRTASACK